MDYWKILLLKQRERGKDGLTIPFLIGSQIFLKNNSNQNIDDLIQELSKNLEFETSIRYCMNIQTLICEIRKEKNLVYKVQSNSINNSLTIAISFKKEIGENIDDVKKYLKEKFEEPIKNQKFSAESDVESRCVKWDNFSRDDINFIKSSFESVGI